MENSRYLMDLYIGRLENKYGVDIAFDAFDDGEKPDYDVGESLADELGHEPDNGGEYFNYYLVEINLPQTLIQRIKADAIRDYTRRQNIRLVYENVDGIEIDAVGNIRQLEKDWWTECRDVPGNDDVVKLVEIDGEDVTNAIKKDGDVLIFLDVVKYLGWE